MRKRNNFMQSYILNLNKWLQRVLEINITTAGREESYTYS